MVQCNMINFVTVGIVEGLDEDEMLNACFTGGVERFAKQFPV